MVASGDLSIIDTSSLLGVREVFGKAREAKILGRLGELAASGNLLFPPEVLAELERGAGSAPDPPLLRARTHRADAERKASLETVKAVLKVAPDLLDPASPTNKRTPTSWL